MPKKAWLLSFVVLINRSGSIALFFLTLYLTNVLNYSVSEAGKIITIYGAGTLAGAFLGGWLIRSAPLRYNFQPVYCGMRLYISFFSERTNFHFSNCFYPGNSCRIIPSGK